MEDNLKLPACPTVKSASYKDTNIIRTTGDAKGFTKLEKAALMIASHLAPMSFDGDGITTFRIKNIAMASKELATAILNECNK